MFPFLQRYYPCSPDLNNDRHSPAIAPPQFNNQPHPPPSLQNYSHNAFKDKDYDWNGIMFMSAVASVCLVFIITVTVYYVCLHRYANRLTQADQGRPSRRFRIARARRFSWRAAENYFLRSPREGLRGTMIDALPVFVYKPESFIDGLRCAVCLCEFEENEKARMLPSCNHSFHVDCIDMWFYSHSTCPLCRATVEAQSDQFVESGRRHEMEVPVIEEEDDDDDDAGEKAFLSSTSGSAAAEQHNECLNQNSDDRKEAEGETEREAHVSIHIPTSES